MIDTFRVVPLAQGVGAITGAMIGLSIVGAFAWRRWIGPALEEVRSFMRDSRQRLQALDMVPDLVDHVGRIDARLEEGDERMGRMEANVGKIANDVNGHPGGIQDRLTGIERTLRTFADHDAANMRDMIARGERRDPVDRRDNP